MNCNLYRSQMYYFILVCIFWSTIFYEFISLNFVFMYLCMLFAWLAVTIFRECILLFINIFHYIYIYPSTPISLSTHFHICINWDYLTCGTVTQHVSALTKILSGDTIYSHKILNWNHITKFCVTVFIK
jgi:hypothetical protein